MKIITSNETIKIKLRRYKDFRCEHSGIFRPIHIALYKHGGETVKVFKGNIITNSSCVETTIVSYDLGNNDMIWIDLNRFIKLCAEEVYEE